MNCSPLKKYFLNVLLCFAGTCFFFACNRPVPKAYDAVRFNDMLNNYWKDGLKLHPLDAVVFGDTTMNDQFQNTCTKAYRDSLHVFNKRYLDSMKTFDLNAMNEQDALSYKVMNFDLKLALEGEKYQAWKIPFTQMGDAGNTLSENMVLAMGQYGSGSSAQPFKTVKNYDDWLKRVNGYTAWCDSAINNFRQGLASNYVLPKALVRKMIDICNNLVKADITKNIFYSPIINLPKTFAEADRERITKEFTLAINTQLNPAHKKLADFLSIEYLPKARSSSGVIDLPNGLNYYKYCAQKWTTTNLSLDSIYSIGISEVKRITSVMDSIKSQVGFKGSLHEFFDYMKSNKQFMPFKAPHEVLDSFNHIYAIVKPNLPKYFSLFPKSKFEIRQTEAFRAASASIEYSQGAPDGSRPGIFYVPVLDPTTFNITSGMESTFLHEAMPGHHFQSSLQMEDSSLPTFRKFKFYGAYAEGWALYGESLGKELGLYTNPYQYMGALGDEIHRAIRLVVDVAIHSRGMRREEAIAYMMENEAIDEQGATAEIERYMADPGQALSYKIGALKLISLRNKYSKLMGEKFDIKEFHKQVLNSGCIPLVVLEDKLDKWAGVKKA